MQTKQQNKQWLTYLLRCADGTLYCGSTNDLERRLEQHNAGKGAKYTRPRSKRPLEVVWTHINTNQGSAFRAEHFVKKMTKAGKEKMVLEYAALTKDDAATRLARNSTYGTSTYTVAIMPLRFYREQKQWYVDLPNWTGPKGALLMVAGADTMLERIGGGKPEVELLVCEVPFNGSDEMLRVMPEELDDVTRSYGGAFYKVAEFEGEKIDHDMWLCDVTLFVFDGHFPNRLYIKRK